MKRILLISNSTLYGSGYLDHAESEIRGLLGPGRRIVFVPFAAYERGKYTAQARTRFEGMGCELISVHDVSNPCREVETADAIFVGGGNTFRLLKGLYDFDLLEPLRRIAAEGKPYIGSSAGSIVAGPSLRTTKDMPVVEPPSFEALGLVPFQISPHYLDPDPSSRHMGETQEERILQFLEENEAPVAGLREGAMLRVEGKTVTLKGSAGARLFRRGEQPVEVLPGAEVSSLLLQSSGSPA
ncbi:MAG: dipeptidase PepE [Acidobacteria bacterium]|nr:MAG: dipeptidase PepE [Acidobacteriota bacterium]